MRPILFLDMDGVIAHLDSYKNQERWDDPLFWECLPKLPWADDLVKACIAGYQTYILTTPCGDASIVGKIAWIKRWYPNLQTRMIFTAHKHLLATHLRVLVDDDPSNCTRFKQMGGIALEVPNPIRWPNTPQFTPARLASLGEELAHTLRQLAGFLVARGG
jgi:5'(3')-deoxyribonucleotidase